MSDEAKTQEEINVDQQCNEIVAKMHEEAMFLKNIGEYEVQDEPEVELPPEEESEPESEPEIEETTEEAAQEYTKEELEAISKGWKPKSTYDGDSSQFRTAREFLERGELLDVIRNQNKRLKRLEEDRTKEKANLLLDRKREAIRNSDVSSAEEYEHAYHELYAPQQEEVSEVAPNLEAARDFSRRNSDWFHNYENNVAENEKMSDFALKHDKYLLDLYPEMADVERLQKVERAVKSKYSYNFGGFKPPREKAAAVNIPSSPHMKKTVASNEKVTYNDLPFEMKKEVSEILPYLNESRMNNPYTKESYIESLVQSGIIRKEKGKIVYG
jgi:hypothetical protein